jgi:hypothetical protein
VIEPLEAGIVDTLPHGTLQPMTPAFHYNELARSQNAKLRLIAARDRKPLTGAAIVFVRALSRRGAQLILESPFIDGLHVLMDVHNTTHKLIELSFPGENPETHQEIRFVGDIDSYSREEDQYGAHFVLNVIWLTDEPSPPLADKDLKRLIRLLKKDAEKTGSR